MAAYRGFVRSRSVRFSAALVLLAILPAFAAGGETLYRSNRLGMRFEEISSAETADHSWILSRSASGNTETLTLLHEGREEKRLERRHGPSGRLVEESVFEEEALRSVQRFDEQGRVAEEQSFEDERLQETRENRYSGAELESVAVSGPDGEHLYTDLYVRTRDRKLREVRREYADGSVRISAFSFSDDRLLQEQHLREQEGVLIRYDAGGRIALREEWSADRLVLLERFSYDGGRLASSTVTYPDTDRREERTYGEEGRIAAERLFAGNVLVGETRYRYEDDALVEKHVEARGISETWRYEYGEDGALRMETYLKDGITEKVTVRSADEEREEWYEELFLDGELFLRVHYRGDEKIREEFIRNGTVIRVRETGEER